MTKAVKSHPIRTCVGCGSRELQSSLLRLQVQPDRAIEVVTRPHAGRSAYVHERTSCIAAVVKSRILRRSLGVDMPRPDRVAAVAYLERRTSLPGAQGARR